MITAVDLFCRLRVFLPWYGAGLLVSIGAACVDADGWLVVLPSVAGYILGCVMPRGLL